MEQVRGGNCCGLERVAGEEAGRGAGGGRRGRTSGVWDLRWTFRKSNLSDLSEKNVIGLDKDKGNKPRWETKYLRFGN